MERNHRRRNLETVRLDKYLLDAARRARIETTVAFSACSGDRKSITLKEVSSLR